MRQLVLGLALLTASFHAEAVIPDVYQPGQHEITLSVAGFERTFLIATPPDLVPQQPLPLVFFFHGAGGTARQAAETYHWSEKGVTDHFLVVYPQGLPFHPQERGTFLFNPNVWRDGRPGLGTEVDDLGFFTATLAWVKENLPVDSRRIYLTGFSNGAGMTFTLGAKFSEQIAAIAPVASHCVIPVEKLTRSLPLYYLTGTEDPLNPLQGGPVRMPWGNTVLHPALQQTLDLWVRLDGCGAKPQIQTENETETVLHYSGNSAEIFFTQVKGLGHHWPGTKEPLPRTISGPVLDPFSATDRIWDFFQKHPL